MLNRLSIFLMLLSILGVSLLFRGNSEGFSTHVPAYPGPLDSVFGTVYFDSASKSLIDSSGNSYIEIRRTAITGPSGVITNTVTKTL